MAKQHFYSRVPARVSMFYKSNGFDTFACSEGISQGFIEKTLATLLEQKPTPEEMKLIRQNELAPIYCHYKTNDDAFVLSCVSFLAKDYSGERTSYLVHSLILNEEEEKYIHSLKDECALNPKLFSHDIEKFDVTNPASRPIKNLEELEIKVSKLKANTGSYFSKFNDLTLRRFIFALLAAISGKYKCVHVVLPNNANSSESVNFLNYVLQILPYHLRKYVSFVSMVSDFNKYPGFKLKVISGSLGDAPVSKGVTINFVTNSITGIKDNDLKLLGIIPELICYLIDKDEEREEFFRFFDHMYSSSEVELKPLDQKTMLDSVLLFRVGSGMYDVNRVLPNDESVISLFEAYAKQREYLTEDYRRNIVKVLQRYPDTYTIIPKQVFSKVVSLYPTETEGTKHILMNVCLELIHTDLMRKQLFNFIKANFDKEDEESKDVIIANLCKVFNGEFLQDEILAFVSAYFDKANKDVRSVILETLFLSIRTVSIQDGLFKFFTTKYDLLDQNEKARLYEVVAEHLPEGDELTKRLLQLCDENITKEDENLQKIYAKSLFKLIDNEQKLKVDLLLSVVTETNGFTFDKITEALFRKRTNRKVLTKFIILSSRGKLEERVDKIIKMWIVADDVIEEKITRKFINAVLKGFEENPCFCTVDEVYSAETMIIKALKDKNTESCIEFMNAFKSEVINNLIISALDNIFKTDHPGAVEELIEYSEDDEQIKSSPNFYILDSYVRLKNSILNVNLSTLIEELASLSANLDFGKRIGNYLTVDVLNGFNKESNETFYDSKYVLTLISSNVLKFGHLRLSSIYEKIQEEVLKKYEDSKENRELIQNIFVRLAKAILDFAFECASKDKFMDDVKSFDSGIYNICSDIVSRYGKKQLGLLLTYPNKDLIKEINENTKQVKSQAGLFSKVIKI